MAIIDSKEAEQTVLGCMILDKSTVPEILGTLSEDSFKYQEHSNLFAIIKELFATGTAIDVITVLGKFGKSPEHKAFVGSICNMVPSTVPFRQYMKIVQEQAQRRAAYTMAVELVSELDDNAPTADCLEQACKITKALGNGGATEAITPLDGFVAVYSTFGKPQQYIPTGFAKLDRDIKISKGKYIVIAGRPSAGKTAFALQIMLSMSRACRAVFFSLETDKYGIFKRLMANYGDTPFSEIMSGELTDYAKLARCSDSFNKLNFRYINAAGWTVQQIQAKAIELQADVIFIDYLSLVRGQGKDLREQVTNVSIDLHTLAQSKNIAVVALSQLNRDGAGEPNLTHLRESGQIEQDADAVMMLYLADETDKGGDRIMKIAKNKEGITGKWTLDFEGEKQRFSEVDRRCG